MTKWGAEVVYSDDLRVEFTFTNNAESISDLIDNLEDEGLGAAAIWRHGDSDELGGSLFAFHDDEDDTAILIDMSLIKEMSFGKAGEDE